MPESTAPMVTGEFRARVTPPPPPPPVPPLPPPGAGIDLLRETVEVQARTIRYLLANYEALLRKVGHGGDVKFKVEAGDVKTFTAGEAIPYGLWFVLSVASIDHDNHQGGTITGAMDVGDVTFSSGTSKAQAGLVMVPLEIELARE